MPFMDNLRFGNNSNLLGLNNNNPSDSNYDGGILDFANQVLALHKDKINRDNSINDIMLQHQIQPINRYDKDHTTNNLVSMGLTPANTQIDTKMGSSSISPLDLAKLKQGEEKIQFGREKEKGELGFKQDKQNTDSQIRQQRADVYDYKSKHPDHKFDFSGPTVKVADPKTGAVYDTGLETGKLSMEDKLQLTSNLGTARDTNRINLTGTNNMLRDNNNSVNNINRDNNRSSNDVMRDSNRINMTEGSNIRRDNNRSTNNLTEIGARGNETRLTNKEKPVTKKSESNSQVNQVHINAATELLNSHPEYAPYIKLGKSANGKVNGFTIEAPKGADDPLYHDINSRIYNTGMGDVKIPSDKSINKSTQFSSSTTKLYTDKSGQKYNIPMDKIEAFLKDNPDAIEVK